MVLLAVAAAKAYPPPVESVGGVRLEIVGLGQGPRPAKADWDRRKINVKEFDAAAELPLTFSLSNGTDKAVSGKFSVWMNEDWTVAGADEQVAVNPGEVKVLKRAARAKPSVLPALYPVHAKFEAAGISLHPIAVIRAKTLNRAFVRSPKIREKLGIGSWRLEVGFRKTVSMNVNGKVWQLTDSEKGDPISGGVFHRMLSGAAGSAARRGFAVHPPYKTGAGMVMADFPMEFPQTADGVRFRFVNELSNGGKERNPGDGVTMRVFAKAADEADFRELFSRNVPESGVRHPGEVDLSSYAGRRIVLRLAVDPGPKNNTAFDSCTWLEPVIEVGKAPMASSEAAWQAREAAAEKKARQALAGGADPAKGAYLLSDRGLAFGAGVEYGASGILDAAIAFTDGRETLTIRGFEVDLDGERLVDLQSAPLVDVRVYAEKGTLRVAWDTRRAQKSLEGSPRFTRLAPGPSSQAAKRVYAGTGCVWEGLKKLIFRANGFSLSTRHAGMDYANGLSLVEATDLPPDYLEIDSTNRIARLVTHNDAVFSFVPSSRGAFDAAFRFASVSGYRASPGIPAMKNRICIDDWTGSGKGGYLLQAEGLRRAKKYGLDDVIYLQHNWQRWGYDARLPEVYPPHGSKAEFDEMARAAQESGYLFGIHDNYVDYYPDAEDFSYRLFCYNEDGTPLEAWYNPGPRSLSYRWLPQAIHPWLKRNLALQRDGFHPTALFLDVFTASGAKDVIDHTGRFHPHSRNLDEWCRTWQECREVYGVPNAVMVSEAGSDSQIGFIDAGEADHFNPRYQAWGCDFADGERVPWHDAVSHGKMLLFGGGLGPRYSRVKPGNENVGDTELHGYGSDDYLSTTVIGGRVPMGPAFGRVTAKTYWMLHDVCGALGQATFEGFAFEDGNLHRLHSRFSRGEVWANRDTNSTWRLPDGRLLPTYGFYAKTDGGGEACVERKEGVRVGWARNSGTWFVDARQVGVGDGGARTVTSRAVSAEIKDNVVEVHTEWNILKPIDEVFRPFTHVVPARGRQIVIHGSGVSLKPAERVTIGRHEGVLRILVPPKTPAGEYAVMYGFYDPKGGRLPIGGRCDDERRVRGGLIRVEQPEGGKMKLSWSTGSQTARDRELDLNVEGKMVDFGGIRTDGAFRFDTNSWRITPMPGSGPFQAEIDLARMGAGGRRVKAVVPVEAETAAKPSWTQQGDVLTLQLDAQAFSYGLVFDSEEECRAAPGVTAGWEDIAEPTREFPETEVVWRFRDSRDGEWTVEKRNGAQGVVEIAGGVVKVQKTNDAGEIVVKAKPFAAAKGRELAFAADVEVDGTDWSRARGMLRAHGEKESFSPCRLDEADGRWGNRCIMWELPNSVPGQTYRKYAQHISEGRVTPVIVISGSPSKSIWRNWLAEDRQRQRRAWCEERDRRNARNRFAETMVDEAAFDAALAADCEHTATVARVEGFSTLLVDGRRTVPMVYRGKHSLLGTSQTELFFGKQLQDQGLKLQIVDVRFGPCGGDMGFWTKDGFDLAGMVKDVKDAMRVSPDSLFMLALGCTVYPEFVEVENPGEAWVTKEGAKAIGHGSSATKYVDKSINAGNRKWVWPSMASRRYRDGICARIRELVRELRRQGLAKRIVGLHTFGYHDAQFTMSLSDHSKPAKAEYRRYLAEGGHASTNYEFFVRQLGFRAQEEFARAFREELGKDIVAAMWWESPLRGRPASSWDLGEFLRSDVMNVIVAQPWYEHRNPAIIGGSHPPFASMHLHGKLFWDEYDLRTYEIIETFRQGPAAIPGGGVSADLSMWRTVFRKLSGVAIANDMGCWFYEKAGGGFSTPAVSADIGEQYRLWQDLLARPRRNWCPSVAVVADEAGVWGWPEGEAFDWNRVEKSYFDQLPLFEASGVPFHIYLLEDVLRDPSLLKDYQMAVFAHLRKVDAARANLLADLRKRRMKLVFLAGAGEVGGGEFLPSAPYEAGGVSAAEFQRLTREAGGYAAMEPNAAQVEMNGRFVSVHALKNGTFDFQLPFDAKVRNLKSGQLEKVQGGKMQLRVTAGETCYFAFE